ncbi:ABC transporter substrate-binding protein [Paenibacillus apiarius]|uniref:Sugar ABC transporter substrate-binding protein n=1 Tax=Paenibacillus apiarius TaxID=46240 RepID=A0ABT4DY25_9BACL|nr:sugar ABC transporter substrate-binding protein [Paenibacillus apiarius]MBN3525104.1 sugar ABC transporter substrate-binding protein [Paenibacillus apiarius]MCY9517452.1 sugar ABC transporter substrate-binding protein [Paenibacillus apiarius]MCY9522269.1 sugar ABC transporter substrate-binding protein [Paenibacillus apiarius]MCY9552303.1 sugar ABC transporter substrate-binding protein [Paenibacillus apiarius]MCY9560182.1 sugar ABC transporter substrate-binding protein [Paenibacillus apiariu
MKKKLGVIAMVAIMAFMTACGGGSKSGTAEGNTASNNSDGKVTNISMQIAWASDSGRGVAIREMLDQFEKENPDVKVEMLGGVQYGSKLLTQILSGKAPEVLQVNYGDVQSLAPEGAFIDLSGDFMADKDNYAPEIWDLSVSDGKLYGMPWLGHSIQLIYNKTMFEKAGITSPPTTWDELYEVAKKLTVDTNGDGKPDQYGIGLSGKQSPDITWMYGMFAAQAGAELVKENNGKYEVAINSPEGQQALEFYTKLLKETSPPDSLNKDGGAIMADFRNGVVAMELQGPWGVSDVWKSGSSFETGVAEVPAGPAGKATEVTAYLLSMPNGVEGEKLEASKKLIKYLSSKPAQELIMKGEKSEDGNYYPFRIPIRKDMADMQYFKEHPEFLVFQEGLKYPFTLFPIPEWSQVSDEVYQNALNQVVSGRISAAEGLKMVQDKGNAIIQK